METNNSKIQITVKNIAQINKPTLDKEVTPLEADLIITADDTNVLGKVIVKAIPDDYIKPEGELVINTSGKQDVKQYASVNVIFPTDKLFNQYMNSTLTQVTEKDLEGATTLRASLFANQMYLSRIAIPDSVTSYGASLCQGCPILVNVKLSSSCTQLSNDMFKSCSNLSRVVVPEGVIYFGGNTFGSCSKLRDIYLPTTFRGIPSNAYSFEYSYGARNIYITDMLSFTKVELGTNGWSFFSTDSKYSLYLNNLLITNLVVPEEALLIGRSLFANSTLQSADLKNVITIKTQAFKGSTALTEVVIGNQLSFIEADAFNGCTNLSSITINKPCMKASDVPTLSNTNAIPSNTIVYVPDEDTLKLYTDGTEASATNWITLHKEGRIKIKQ